MPTCTNTVLQFTKNISKIRQSGPPSSSIDYIATGHQCDMIAQSEDGITWLVDRHHYHTTFLAQPETREQ